MAIDAKLSVRFDGIGADSRSQAILASVIDSTGTDVVSRSFDVPYTDGEEFLEVYLSRETLAKNSMDLQTGPGYPGLIVIVLERAGDSNVLGVGGDHPVDIAFATLQRAGAAGEADEDEWYKTYVAVSDILVLSVSELPYLVAFRTMAGAGTSRRVTMFVTGTAALPAG